MARFDADLLRAMGCKPETVQRILMDAKKLDLRKAEEDLKNRQIRLLVLGEEGYPARLADASDAPPFLYARGDLAVLDHPCLSIVGTRAMSSYGRRVIEWFVPAFVRAGLITISGLAYGVDACVAEETLRGAGRTVAVLAHGLGMIHPYRHEFLAKKILDGGGLLLSEFALWKKPEEYTFPARNRIVAALGLATLVIEAPQGSGALITARIAHGYGREVFAIPGQIFDENFSGCHQYLAQRKATLAASPEDVLREMGIIPPVGGKAAAFTPRTTEEQNVFSILTTMPQPVDGLTERTRLAPAALSATLTMLELAGAAKNIGGGLWVRM